MSSSVVRSWRTAFLTLRDETLAAPAPVAVLHLLNQLIFSQSHSLTVAAPYLPSREVTSDLILLMELARNLSHFEGIEDLTQAFIKLSQLIHGIGQSSSLEMNSTSFALVLDSFTMMVRRFFDKAQMDSEVVWSVTVIKPTKQCLESLRFFFGLHHAVASLSENEQVLNFVLQVVQYFQEESKHSYLSDNRAISGSVCEVLIIAFAMIGELYSRVGTSLSVEIWKSTIEVLRKVMDLLASRSLLLEDNIFAMFYIELLHCLHFVLTEPRGNLSDHVAGFVAALRVFLHYGLVNKSHVMNQTTNHRKEVSSTNQNLSSEVSSKARSGAYRPPHLRKKVLGDQQCEDEECLFSPRHEFVSSDSDCSDNDGSLMDNITVNFAKARVAAIHCIQDLCRADPKFFTAQWTMLLPSNDVLQHRKYDTTLISCLLFDPSLKVRISAASTVMTMLDGQASISLQVAEYRGHSKCGSFTALSSSLGHILMQLHSGTLYLIKHETNSRLLALSFKILLLLVSSTPYSRMSPELLPRVLSSLRTKIDEGFPFHNDRNSLLASAMNCLSLALAASASMHVNNMLLGEISTGSHEGQRSGVLYSLFRYSEQLSCPSISLEAFQALKAVAHNYPNVMTQCWEHVSSIIYGVLSSFSEVPARMWRGNVEHAVAPIKERVMTAAIKVLDECLRAISGFRGTEDLSNEKSFESPFTSDYVKTKAVSSAPSYNFESAAPTNYESNSCMLASERWLEAIKHMPIIIEHSSAMVRAASVTCFAGMTSSVFFSLPKDKHEYIISSSINAALNDGSPSVRSAACRAIGVIVCFPQIYHSSEVLGKFIHAAVHNSRDSLVSVRITASWALANICDSVSHCMDAVHAGRVSIESRTSSEFISLLVDSALRLARDNDKVKANAVRGLGNLSRSIQFTIHLPARGDPDCLHSKIEYCGAQGSKDHMKEMLHSLQSSSGGFDWLEQMVQTFLSCVTTGNVKVQWNVCHALSNLFLNKTLKLQDMDWASSVFSILLLLLRDSSNFKIRIQAASALAVPETINDYGKSYYDVVKSVEHVVENFRTAQISEASNFKYWIALEKQLTSTLLHLLDLASTCDQRAMQDFLIKKASFLESWINELCSSLGDTSNWDDESRHASCVDQKKDVIFRTIQSLIQVYESSNHNLIAKKFDRLAGSLP